MNASNTPPGRHADGPTEPSRIEPVPVQLTRMEGTINLIAYQFGEVKDDIKDLRGEAVGLARRVAAIEMEQARNTGSTDSWRSWLPVILTAFGVLVALGLSIDFR